MNLQELKAKLDEFSPAKIRFIANVVDSLANPPRADIQQRGTWITGSPDWIEYFGLALSVHHGATSEPLGLTAFETVFRNACKSVNWTLAPPGAATPALRRSGGYTRYRSEKTPFPEIHRGTENIRDLSTHLQTNGGRVDTGHENAEGQTHTNAGSFPGLPTSGGCHHYATRLPQRGRSESLPAARNPDCALRLDSESPA